KTAGIYQLLSSLVGNYVNSTASMTAYLDAGNVHFGTGTLLASGLVDNQAALSSVPIGAGPFSLTEIITLTAGANSLTSLVAALVDVPEPGSLFLVGAGVFALMGAGWFRPRPRASKIAA